MSTQNEKVRVSVRKRKNQGKLFYVIFLCAEKKGVAQLLQLDASHVEHALEFINKLAEDYAQGKLPNTNHDIDDPENDREILRRERGERLRKEKAQQKEPAMKRPAAAAPEEARKIFKGSSSGNQAAVAPNGAEGSNDIDGDSVTDTGDDLPPRRHVPFLRFCGA